MAAIDDVELHGNKVDGLRTIMIRNKTTDKTIEASVFIGGACEESTIGFTLKPLGEAQVVHERPGDTLCHYQIDLAKYVAS
jgi:hypothetical protein